MPVLATTTVRTMTRRDIATAMVFDKFRDAFEHAAPIFDAAAVHEIAARDGSGMRSGPPSRPTRCLRLDPWSRTRQAQPTDRS